MVGLCVSGAGGVQASSLQNALAHKSKLRLVKCSNLLVTSSQRSRLLTAA